MNPLDEHNLNLTRRDLLFRAGGSIGAMALGSLLGAGNKASAAEKPRASDRVARSG